MVFYDYFVFGSLIGIDWEYFNKIFGCFGIIFVLRLIKERFIIVNYKCLFFLELEIIDIVVYFYVIMFINI